MPIKPPTLSGGAMIQPFTYASTFGGYAGQKRNSPPEEAFDRMLDSYAHSHRQNSRSLEHGVIPVDDVREMFVSYVSHFEAFYRSMGQALNDHMSVCMSPSPWMQDMRKNDLRNLFSQGYVVQADRRSGKTSALFDEADEVSRATSSRITIISPRKEYVMAEACRRRLENATPNQFVRLEFMGENDLHNLDGMSRDVMVDEWWDLSERTRELLSNRFNVMAAVGTIPHGTRIPITARAQRDEDGYYGRKPDTYNPLAMARWKNREL